MRMFLWRNKPLFYEGIRESKTGEFPWLCHTDVFYPFLGLKFTAEEDFRKVFNGKLRGSLNDYDLR